jgi:hypothetical protein
MTDRKKDEPIIELTEVIEDAPSSAAGAWMETTPPPSLEKEIAEPPKVTKKASPVNPEDLRAIPESPLKKFLLAEEEPTPPAEPPIAGKPLGFSQPGSQPPRPAQEPPRPAPGPPRVVAEPPRTAPEPPKMAAQPPRTAPEPSRPSLPNMEAEMRAIREAMLARVEKWAAQEGVRVLERVAREIFPGIAEGMIRKEIEKLKAEAEEKG